MANINIKFNGKEYLLSCEDGQEEHLQELAQNLNEKFDSLKSSLGHIGENKLLLISSITVMDEYFDTKKKIDEKKKELNNLTEKFKELKSLVYEYKDTKEKQIAQLIDQNKQIQNQVESSKNNFNEVIENTTLQIEQFLDKVKKIN